MYRKFSSFPNIIKRQSYRHFMILFVPRNKTNLSIVTHLFSHHSHALLTALLQGRSSWPLNLSLSHFSPTLIALFASLPHPGAYRLGPHAGPMLAGHPNFGTSTVCPNGGTNEDAHSHSWDNVCMCVCSRNVCMCVCSRNVCMCVCSRNVCMCVCSRNVCVFFLVSYSLGYK